MNQNESSAADGENSHSDNRTLGEITQSYLKTVNEMLQSKPEHFQTLICHAVLKRDIAGVDAASLPFGPSGKSERLDFAELEERVRQRYVYLADLLLRRKENLTDLPLTPYVSLAQWIEAETILSIHSTIRLEFDSMRPMDIWHQYFNEYLGGLSYSVALATLNVYRGVPLYRMDTSRNGYVLLDRHDPLFHYLYLRGKAFDAVESLELPDWTSTLFFNQEHLRWHGVFFDSLHKEDPDEVKLRRSALQKHLGLPALSTESLGHAGGRWPWGEHETELLKLLADAAKRFWVNFDPANNETAPKNEDVSNWLKERNVSGRNADAIATILRADGLPTGPRT